MSDESWTLCPEPECGARVPSSSDVCPNCGTPMLAYAAQEVTMPGSAPVEALRELEIDTAARRRWTGLIGYVLFFLIVAGALVTMFFRFTGSMRMAVVVVTFMISYMLVMGWIAARDPARKSESAGRAVGATHASPAFVIFDIFKQMSVSWDTFERYRQKGLDARRAGQWDSARVYLLEAARAMVELSKAPQGEELREGRRQMAERLLELAKDCETAQRENRRSQGVSRKPSPRESSTEAEGSASADQWIVREKPSLRFDDVAGLEDVKQDIRLKMIYPFEHPELAEKFGIRAGGGVLMYGPPGTGKTMLAKATAGEIEATFFRVSPADVLSKWVGEAEQNIKKLFDAAAGEERSIIFIDEIEALVPARRDEGSSVMQRVVPQILQGIEGFDKKAGRPILLMGATNVPWQLDPAILRPGRFDEKVYIPLPDLAARRKMLEIYLTHRPLASNVDLDALADRLEGFSGADIRYLCDRAATVPFLQSVASGQDGEITTAILADVVADTPRSVNDQMLQRFDEWSKAAASA